MTTGEEAMLLNVLERLLLLNILPKEGSFTNLRLLRVAREALSFTEGENKALAFKQDGDNMKWEDNAVDSKEFEIGEVVTQIVVDALKKLNDEGKLIDAQFSLYEKFIEGK